MKTYFTMKKDQKCVTLPIYEGESKKIAENNQLGKFSLDNLPPGEAKVKDRLEVTFAIDADGIMNVTAKDTAGGESKEI
jgi:molecular chaperone DnaK